MNHPHNAPGDRGTGLEEREKLIKKVSAILAKAASSEHEPEKHAFEAKAQALITRYQIDQAELRQAGSVIERTFNVDGWGNATRGVVHLWSGIAELNQCAVAHRTGRGWAQVILAGDETGADVTARLVDHLLPQLRLAILSDRPRSRMSFAVGWSHEVIARLTQAQTDTAEAVAAESGLNPEAGMALVPTNDAATRALAEAHNVKQERRTSVDIREYGSGAAAAEQVDLGHGQISAPD